MIYSQPEFLERLSQERSRSDRTRAPFTLVLLPVDGSHFNPHKPNGLHRIVDTLGKTLRRSDLWGLYTRDQLALLLTDTNEAAARHVLSRLAHHLSDHAGPRPAPLVLRDGRYALIEYPKALEQDLLKEIIECAECGAATRRAHARPSNGGNGRGTHTAQPLDRRPQLDLLEQTCLCGQDRTHGVRTQLYELGKRCIDIIGALAGLLITALLFPPIALAIKATSRGPVIFRQTRIGRRGRTFTFLKYRTMYQDCDQTIHKQYMERLIQDTAEQHEKDGNAFYKLADDPRITPVGRFLRKTSLDELPQFYNVLKGEMSLVGPRPPIPYEVEKYEAWQLRRILEAKPGITGLWQVSGRSTTTFAENVRLDLRYIENRSLRQDIKILFKTVFVIFETKGAC